MPYIGNAADTFRCQVHVNVVLVVDVLLLVISERKLRSDLQLGRPRFTIYLNEATMRDAHCSMAKS